MRLRLAVVVFCLLTVLASHVGQGSGASAGSNAGRQADLAGIEGGRVGVHHWFVC